MVVSLKIFLASLAVLSIFMSEAAGQSPKYFGRIETSRGQSRVYGPTGRTEASIKTDRRGGLDVYGRNGNYVGKVGSGSSSSNSSIGSYKSFKDRTQVYSKDGAYQGYVKPRSLGGVNVYDNRGRYQGFFSGNK